MRQQIVYIDVNELRAHPRHRSEPAWPSPRGPGTSRAIRTPILADHAPVAAAMAATMAGAGVGLSAIPRVAEPDEITRMVLFVASDEASFSTGSEFIVDGGVLLGPAPQRERAAAAVA